MEVFLGFVTKGAKRGVVICLSAPEGHRLFGVDPEAGQFLVAEKTLAGVMGVWLGCF
jgi:hypothetical protein